MSAKAIRFRAPAVSPVGDTATWRAIAVPNEKSRSGVRIMSNAWNLEPFRRNPIILAWHDDTKPVGRAVTIRCEGAVLEVSFRFASPGVSPAADHVRGLVEEGVLSGVSVGFYATKFLNMPKGEVWITGAELFEISLVSVPDFRGAVVERLSAGGREDPAIRRHRLAAIDRRMLIAEAQLRKEASRAKPAAHFLSQVPSHLAPGRLQKERSRCG